MTVFRSTRPHKRVFGEKDTYHTPLLPGFELPRRFAQYAVEKGSIAVDGISLTIAEVSAKKLVLWIIPHTKRHTNLDRATPGDWVNLEFDLLAKYVERMLPSRQRSK